MYQDIKTCILTYIYKNTEPYIKYIYICIYIYIYIYIYYVYTCI